MPLPFLAAIPALIAAASTTTLVVGGAVAAVGVMASLGAFFTYIDRRKEELGAFEARIDRCEREGNYARLKVGLRDRKKRLLETVEAEVRDEQRKLRVGQII